MAKLTAAVGAPKRAQRLGHEAGGAADGGDVRGARQNERPRHHRQRFLQHLTKYVTVQVPHMRGPVAFAQTAQAAAAATARQSQGCLRHHMLQLLTARCLRMVLCTCMTVQMQMRGMDKTGCRRSSTFIRRAVESRVGISASASPATALQVAFTGMPSVASIARRFRGGTPPAARAPGAGTGATPSNLQECSHR